MLFTILRFVRGRRGATAIEYGLIAALVSVAAITALQAMGGSLDAMFDYVSGLLADNIPEEAATSS